MSDINWVGGAEPTYYAVTLTALGIGTGTGSLGVTINGKTVSAAVAGAMTPAEFAESLATALQASLVPEFLEVSWSNTTDDPVVTGTGRVLGLTIVLESAGTLPATLPFPWGQGPGDTSAGLALARTVTQATGPNDLANADNYSSATLPVNSDTLTFAPGSPAVYYGLDALSGVSLTTVTIPAGYAGPIGLPAVHTTDRGQTYPENRGRYLDLGGNPAVNVGEGDGAGIGRCLLDVGSGSCTLSVFGTAARVASDVPAVNWVNTGGGNVLNVAGGDVGLAAEAGQAATVATLRTPRAELVGTPPLFSGGTVPGVTVPAVFVGAGATVTATDIDGGDVNAHGTTTALTMTGGTWTQWAGTLGTITCDGGTVKPRVGGITVTTATFRSPDAVCDLSADPRPITFADHEFTGGAALKDPNKRLTMTNAGTWDQESVANSTFGNGRFSLRRT